MGGVLAGVAIVPRAAQAAGGARVYPRRPAGLAAVQRNTPSTTARPASRRAAGAHRAGHPVRLARRGRRPRTACRRRRVRRPGGGCRAAARAQIASISNGISRRAFQGVRWQATKVLQRRESHEAESPLSDQSNCLRAPTDSWGRSRARRSRSGSTTTPSSSCASCATRSAGRRGAASSRRAGSGLGLSRRTRVIYPSNFARARGISAPRVHSRPRPALRPPARRPTRAR